MERREQVSIVPGVKLHGVAVPLDGYDAAQVQVRPLAEPLGERLGKKQGKVIRGGRQLVGEDPDPSTMSSWWMLNFPEPFPPPGFDFMASPFSAGPSRGSVREAWQASHIPSRIDRGSVYSHAG